MKTIGKMSLLAFVSLLFLACTFMILASPVTARETFLWTEQVLSNGVEVVSPTLQAGILYGITASGRWWHNYSGNLGADAQYYTTDPADSIYWRNYFPAPGGASFLQINSQNVTWGPYTDGNTDHTYMIFYNGTGGSLTFRIVDWMDGNYSNNVCHIHVTIRSVILVGGHVVDSNQWNVVTYFTISALIFTVVITVPIVKCQKKT